MAPNTLPALAKAGANYMNSQLIKMEAVINGYSEGIALDATATSAKARARTSSWCATARSYTPPLGASVLPGITRDTVLQARARLGIPVVETIIPREMLYIADEVFFSGTAAEITPIRSVDDTGRHGRARPHHGTAAKGVLCSGRRTCRGPLRLADGGKRRSSRPLGCRRRPIE